MNRKTGVIEHKIHMLIYVHEIVVAKGERGIVAVEVWYTGEERDEAARGNVYRCIETNSGQELRATSNITFPITQSLEDGPHICNMFPSLVKGLKPPQWACPPCLRSFC